MSAMTVIALYRSQADRTLAERLAEELSDKNEPFLVIGDFNLCSRSLPNHEVFNVLTRLEFRFEMEFILYDYCNGCSWFNWCMFWFY